MPTLPVAPGAYGQPPSPPDDASNFAMPCCSAGVHVGERRAARIVEVHRDALERNPLREQRHELVDLARHADADRVADRKLVASHLHELHADVDAPSAG